MFEFLKKTFSHKAKTSDEKHDTIELASESELLNQGSYTANEPLKPEEVLTIQDAYEIIAEAVERDKFTLNESLKNLELTKNYIASQGASELPIRPEVVLQPMNYDNSAEKKVSSLALSATDVGTKMAKISDEMLETVLTIRQELTVSKSAMARMSKT
jgi:hypothetical protein